MSPRWCRALSVCLRAANKTAAPSAKAQFGITRAGAKLILYGWRPSATSAGAIYDSSTNTWQCITSYMLRETRFEGRWA